MCSEGRRQPGLGSVEQAGAWGAYRPRIAVTCTWWACTHLCCTEQFSLSKWQLGPQPSLGLANLPFSAFSRHILVIQEVGDSWPAAAYMATGLSQEVKRNGSQNGR